MPRFLVIYDATISVEVEESDLATAQKKAEANCYAGRFDIHNINVTFDNWSPWVETRDEEGGS